MSPYVLACLCVVTLAAPSAAQTPAARPAAPTQRPNAVAPEPSAAQAPTARQQPPNVRLDVRIVDNYGGAEISKVSSLLMGSVGRMSSSIRTGDAVTESNPRAPRLNIDAMLWDITNDGAVDLQLTLDYLPPASRNAADMPQPLQEKLRVLLHDGKALLVSQSADPSTTRKVTVEVTATILK